MTAYNIFPARELTAHTVAIYAKAMTFIQMLALSLPFLRKTRDKITATAATRKQIAPMISVTSYSAYPKAVSGLPGTIPHSAPNADRKIQGPTENMFTSKLIFSFLELFFHPFRLNKQSRPNTMPAALKSMMIHICIFPDLLYSGIPKTLNTKRNLRKSFCDYSHSFSGIFFGLFTTQIISQKAILSTISHPLFCLSKFLLQKKLQNCLWDSAGWL